MASLKDKAKNLAEEFKSTHPDLNAAVQENEAQVEMVVIDKLTGDNKGTFNVKSGFLNGNTILQNQETGEKLKVAPEGKRTHGNRPIDAVHKMGFDFD